MGAGGPEEGEGPRQPPWLKPLLTTRFFGHCKNHADAHHRSECNMFCLDCFDDGALCPSCLSHHSDHHTIQIRRSSYHDVIRVNEIQKHLDITGVQTYVINSARVVFLNERPQPKLGKGVVNLCEVCHRSLLDSFKFCSLGCKISDNQFVGGFLDDARRSRKKKRVAGMESGSEDESYTGSEKSNLTHSFSPRTPPLAAAVNYRTTIKRRKGIPHRAPFGSLIVEF